MNWNYDMQQGIFGKPNYGMPSYGMPDYGMPDHRMPSYGMSNFHRQNLVSQKRKGNHGSALPSLLPEFDAWRQKNTDSSNSKNKNNADPFIKKGNLGSENQKIWQNPQFYKRKKESESRKNFLNRQLQLAKEKKEGEKQKVQGTQLQLRKEKEELERQKKLREEEHDQIRKKQLKESEFFDMPRQCHVCKDEWYFENAFTYFLHTRDYSHQYYRELTKKKNKLTLEYLELKAKVAEEQRKDSLAEARSKKTSVLESKKTKGDKGELLQRVIDQCSAREKLLLRESPELTMFKTFSGPQKCTVCGITTEGLDNYDKHLYSESHHVKVFEAAKKEGTLELYRDPLQNFVFQDGSEIQTTADDAADCSMNSESLPQYEIGDACGLDKLFSRDFFFCSVCQANIFPGAVEKHAKSKEHHEKLIKDFTVRELQERNRQRLLEEMPHSDVAIEGSSMEDGSELPDGKIKCDVCDITVTCRENYYDHVQGKKHINNVKQMKVADKVRSRMQALGEAIFSEEADIASEHATDADACDPGATSVADELADEFSLLEESEKFLLDPYDTTLTSDAEEDQRGSEWDYSDNRTSDFDGAQQEIADAKENAEICPISLEDPPDYDENEVFGLEFLECAKLFNCVACNSIVKPGSIHTHSKTLTHFRNVMRYVRHLEKQKIVTEKGEKEDVTTDAPISDKANEQVADELAEFAEEEKEDEFDDTEMFHDFISQETEDDVIDEDVHGDEEEFASMLEDTVDDYIEDDLFEVRNELGKGNNEADDFENVQKGDQRIENIALAEDTREKFELTENNEENHVAEDDIREKSNELTCPNREEGSFEKQEAGKAVEMLASTESRSDYELDESVWVNDLENNIIEEKNESTSGSHGEDNNETTHEVEHEVKESYAEEGDITKDENEATGVNRERDTTKKNQEFVQEVETVFPGKGRRKRKVTEEIDNELGESAGGSNIESDVIEAKNESASENRKEDNDEKVHKLEQDVQIVSPQRGRGRKRKTTEEANDELTGSVEDSSVEDNVIEEKNKSTSRNREEDYCENLHKVEQEVEMVAVPVGRERKGEVTNYTKENYAVEVDPSKDRNESTGIKGEDGDRVKVKEFEQEDEAISPAKEKRKREMTEKAEDELTENVEGNILEDNVIEEKNKSSCKNRVEDSYGKAHQVELDVEMVPPADSRGSGCEVADYKKENCAVEGDAFEDENKSTGVNKEDDNTLNEKELEQKFETVSPARSGRKRRVAEEADDSRKYKENQSITGTRKSARKAAKVNQKQ